MPRKKPIFTEDFMFSLFGQKVQVHQELHRGVGDNNVFAWTPYKPQRRGPFDGMGPVGWVVGFRWLLTGRVTAPLPKGRGAVTGLP